MKIFKKFLSGFEYKSVKDSYFGEMSYYFDKFDDCYYLEKDLELEAVSTQVVLSIKSNKLRTNEKQQKTYKLIEDNFSLILNRVENFLIEDFLTEERLKKEFRLDMITILDEIENNLYKWEIDFFNLKDGFTKIVVEMDKFNPIHFSTQG